MTPPAPQMAIIFTESRRTQSYLLRVLADNPWGSGIVLFNGSNTDDRSKTIYARWLARHDGTDPISGSKSADIRSALVDYFREEGTTALTLRPSSPRRNASVAWNPPATTNVAPSSRLRIRLIASAMNSSPPLRASSPRARMITLSSPSAGRCAPKPLEIIHMPLSSQKLSGSRHRDFPHGRIEVFPKILLAGRPTALHVQTNTRAVPLVRKNDAHQGRVSFLPKFEASREGVTA